MAPCNEVNGVRRQRDDATLPLIFRHDRLVAAGSCRRRRTGTKRTARSIGHTADLKGYIPRDLWFRVRLRDM
jgi:hypothetical protein